MNFIPAIGGEDGRSIVLDLGIRQTVELGYAVEPGRPVTAGLRPEHVTLASPGAGTLNVPVAVVESTGSATYVTTATTPELAVVINGRADIRAGETIGLDFSPAQLHLFDVETEQRL
jgi:multiple sugar transport system ATP-binding protein